MKSVCFLVKHTIWLWLTVRHGKIHPFFKFGKPSISMGHLYHGELWNNHRVYKLVYNPIKYRYIYHKSYWNCSVDAFFRHGVCRVGFLNKKHLPVDRRRSSSLSWWLSPLNPLKNMSQLGWIEIPNIYIYILYIYYILYILYILYYVYIIYYILYIYYIYIYGKRKFMFQTTNQC